MVSYLLIELFYISMSLVWTDGRTSVWSSDYQNFYGAPLLKSCHGARDLSEGSTDTEKKRRVLPQVPGQKEVIIGNFIIYMAESASGQYETIPLF